MSDLQPLRVRFGDFQLDEGNARLSRHGRPVELQPRAFAVLCVLARQPGQLVTKDTLLDAVWGHRHISESVLKTVVSHLRNALDDDARQPLYIETASRRGYRFIAALDRPSIEPAAPRADPGIHAAAPALIGRSAPLDVLQDCFDAARRGKRQLVLVAGEAGIGKSTLIDRFVDAMLPSRPALAVGQCVEHYGPGEPYMPVLEALNMLCRGDDGSTMLGWLRRVAPTWLAQLPWYLEDEDRRALQREVAGATQDRMLREFGELLDRCTTERALLLVLEDLHWCDHATVQLIGYLARRRTAASLMLLGSFRPTDVIVEEHPLAGLRQELRLHRLCREIDLEAFSEADVGELVAERLDGRPAPEAFVRALHAHTEGLPLFVVNVLDELIADGSLRREEQGWSFPEAVGFSVPRSIAGVIDKQIGRLPSGQRRVLEAASVAGVEFMHLALPEVLQMAPADVREALDTAAARHQWVRSAGVVTLPGGGLAARYAFRHALYQHVFYERLGLAQRMQWHGQIAASLQAAYAGAAPEIAAELAMHFERSGAFPAAIRQLAAVAGRSLARSAAPEALRAARRGLELLAHRPDPQEQGGIELDLRVLEGVALTRLHVISEPEVAAAFERARVVCERVGDSPARARALHGLWWVSLARCELPQARALAQRILDLGDDEAGMGLTLAGSSAMGLTLAMMGELREARRCLEKVLELHAALGDRLAPGMFVQDPGVEARGYLALVLWWMGEPAQARRLAGEAVALAAHIRHPISQVIALHLFGALHYFADEYTPSLHAIEQLFGVIRSHGLPTAPGAFSWLHGHLVAIRGQVDQGMAEMRAAERSCQRLGMRIGLTGYQLHYAEACRDAGLVDEACAAIEQGLSFAQTGHERFLLSPLHRLKAELLIARGEPRGAAASLDAALAIAVEQGAHFHELGALVVAGRLRGLSDRAQRDRLRTILASYQDERMRVVIDARALLDAR
ncbi:AAA family ATPase [Piscinibacter sp. XHJ-5]|uniref:ATP-binding protein n=1 Tax=Piscinibacter sp. XHJ-5 TaxID=3037797 RepID=UPI002452FBDD|nr:AAA family ATPase [Piscinibacter sp. XHJ-5]